MVWHGDAAVPACDLIVLPGGFAYGDYLRCGAMAAHSPDHARRGRQGQGRHARARHLQRLPGADRGRAAAGRADAQRLAQVRLPRRAPEGRADRHALHQPLRARARSSASPSPTATATTSPTRRRSTRSRARAASCSATSTRPATPRAEANPNGAQRNIAGICDRAPARARHDAASRAPVRAAARRHRRPPAVRERARHAALSAGPCRSCPTLRFLPPIRSPAWCCSSRRART